MPIVNDIAQVIADAGLATLGETLFRNFLPEQPDDIVVVNSTGGGAPSYVQEQATPSHTHDTFQVMVRRTEDDTHAANVRAEVDARAVFDEVVAVRNQTIGLTFYLKITPFSVPFLVERDTMNRALYAFNATAIRNNA